MVFLGIVAIITTLINGVVLITESIRRCLRVGGRREEPCVELVDLGKVEKVD